MEPLSTPRYGSGGSSVVGGDQAGFGVVGGHVGDVLDVWRMTKQSSLAGSGRSRRGAAREGFKVVALLVKSSLGLFGLVGWRRVLLPYPGSATGYLIEPGDHHTLQHIQVHFDVDFQADFEDVRWHDVALTWNNTKDHNRSRKLCFHHPGHVPVISGNPDLHFEDAGNGPVVITWIGREHELYSGASPISLVEHCVTFRHDRRLLSLLGFVHNWPTSRWSAKKKKKKKENRFSLNGNGIMSSFLGQQFYRTTLYIYKQHLAFNNLQVLICHKTQLNQIICIWYICITRIWHLITYNCWYTIKPNQTKPNQIIYILYICINGIWH